MILTLVRDLSSKVVRIRSKERLAALMNQYTVCESIQIKNSIEQERNLYFFSDFALKAGVSSGQKLLIYCGMGAFITLIASFLVYPILAIPSAFLGFGIPLYFAKSAARERTLKFSEEYPVVLMAAASNMKAGLTIYTALERAILLLSEDSEIKKEVMLFLERISKGMQKEEAVQLFGKSYDIPELDLFRRAFNLVLTHGGRFSRTLERLAQVCRDRENLIKSAKVSTTSMRMTANILLCLAPLLLLVMAARTPNYWNVFFGNTLAFTLASIGSTIIVGSFIALRFMSDFKA